MANIKSAIKRIELTQKATLRNRVKKTEIKNAIKKFESAVSAGSKDEAAGLLKEVDKKLKRAANKHIIHKNAASRKLSSLTKKLNAIG